MLNGYECPRCGRHIGNHQVHSDEVCQRQQETNRQNLGLTCPWCGSKGQHKDGCPRRAADIRRALGNLPSIRDWKLFGAG